HGTATAVREMADGRATQLRRARDACAARHHRASRHDAVIRTAGSQGRPVPAFLRLSVSAEVPGCPVHRARGDAADGAVDLRACGEAVTDRRRVTIVTPVYNEEACLPSYGEAVRSALLARTDTGYDVLFVDDGSTDASWTLIEQ